MVVLDGAPLERTVSGALWAAFAGGGRHRAAVGRLVVVPSMADALLGALVAGAERLHPGDPRRRDTEIGPLRSPETRARVEELVAEAVAEGATLLCGGPLEVPDVAGAFYAPAVLRGVRPGARILREPVPGPVLGVVEAADEDEAIALAKRAPAVSVWARERAHGERVARELEAGVAWVNEHGHSIPDAAVRLAGHVEAAPDRLAAHAAALRPLAPVRPAARPRRHRVGPPGARPRDRAAPRAADRRAAARPNGRAAGARGAREMTRGRQSS